MEDDLVLYINQTCKFKHGKNKDGKTIGNLMFLGGTIFVPEFDPASYPEGSYLGATFACDVFNGNPSPRRLLQLNSKADKAS